MSTVPETLHITVIDPRDSAGHYSWHCTTCREPDADGSGYETGRDVVEAATAHGSLAADSLKPVDDDEDEDEDEPVPSLLGDRRREIAARDAVRAAQLPAFIRHARDIGADFDLPVTTAEQLTAVLHAIGGHNNYNEERAAAMLGPFVDRCRRVRVHCDITGPSLYFLLPFWTHQTIAAARLCDPTTHQLLSDADRVALAAEVIAVARDLQTDEVSVRQYRTDRPVANDWVWNGPGDQPYEIRLWWD